VGGKRTKKAIWSPLRLLLLGLLLAGVTVLPSSALPAAEPPLVESPREDVPLEAAPAEELLPLPEPVPEEPRGIVGIVPAADPLPDDTYFTDVVFLGDSRTEGLYLYGGMTEAEYLYAMGANVESVFTKKDWGGEGEKISLLDALLESGRSRIYVMLGVNELGWPQTEMFRQRYTALLERLRADHPEGDIVIQSILPVSARQDDKGTYVNNGRINEYNAVLLDLAETMGYPYLDVAEAVRDEAGCLRSDLTSDGVHLNTAGCKVWLDYLRTHPLEP